MNSDVLFRPITIHGMTLRNRIVMTPTARLFATDEGIPTPAMAEHYRRRSADEVGLIVTDGAIVDHPSAATCLEPWSRHMITNLPQRHRGTEK
jgi:2,4-dienoyl-CoA reductase-like NADH-dependent reductase (Old Yellow Enzyme family)